MVKINAVFSSQSLIGFMLSKGIDPITADPFVRTTVDLIDEHDGSEKFAQTFLVFKNGDRFSINYKRYVGKSDISEFEDFEKNWNSDVHNNWLKYLTSFCEGTAAENIKTIENLKEKIELIDMQNKSLSSLLNSIRLDISGESVTLEKLAHEKAEEIVRDVESKYGVTLDVTQVRDNLDL